MPQPEINFLSIYTRENYESQKVVSCSLDLILEKFGFKRNMNENLDERNFLVREYTRTDGGKIFYLYKATETDGLSSVVENNLSFEFPDETEEKTKNQLAEEIAKEIKTFFFENKIISYIFRRK